MSRAKLVAYSHEMRMMPLSTLVYTYRRDTIAIPQLASPDKVRSAHLPLRKRMKGRQSCLKGNPTLSRT